jgi:hypothetical protein
MTQLGQRSAAGVGAAGMDTATQIGQAYTQAGQARAGSIMGQANAFNQALGTITGFGTSAAGQSAIGKIF